MTGFLISLALLVFLVLYVGQVLTAAMGGVA